MEYNYMVQIEIDDKQLLLAGAMSYEGAGKLAIKYMLEENSTRAYIWPQSAAAKRKIDKRSYKGADYVEITIDREAIPGMTNWYGEEIKYKKVGED